MKIAAYPLSADGRGIIIVLGFLVALGPLATDMYLPSLPGIASSLGVTSAEVQLTLSAYLFGFAIAQLICGPLSDRFGRRPIMMGGLALFMIASVLCAQAQTIEQLIFFRVLQAIGGCVGPVLGRAMVRDLFEGERAAYALSMVGIVMGLSPAIAPFFGGYLQNVFGWSASFYALGAYAGVMIVLLWACVSETNRYQNPKATAVMPMLRNYGTLLKSKLYVGYMMTLTWCFAGLFAWLSGSVFVLEEVYGFNPVNFGFVFVWCVGAYMSGSMLSARLGPKIGVDKTLFVGCLLSALGGSLALAFELIGVHSLVVMVGCLCIFFIALGIVMPQAMTGAMMPFPHMAGAASALLGFVQMAGSACVGIMVGQLHDGTAIPMLVVIAVCGVLTLVSYVVFVLPNRIQSQTV